MKHYRLVERLDDARSEVWRAVDTRNDREVAVKFLPHLSDPAKVEDLRRNADALASVDHGALASILDHGETDGRYFVCTDAIEGASLLEAVPRGGFEPEATLRHAVTLVDAVTAAHEAGVTHRELGPDRVFITAGDSLRIHDFGLSEAEEGGEDTDLDPDDTPTLTLTREGARRNLAYLSPEQIKNHPLDASTDIYSLGAILYWVATGVHPFRGDSLADLCVAVLRDTPRPVNEMRHDVPEGFGPVIERCLEKERKKRYATARDLLGDLAKLV